MEAYFLRTCFQDITFLFIGLKIALFSNLEYFKDTVLINK